MFECRLIIDKGIWYFVFEDEWHAEEFYRAVNCNPSKGNRIVCYGGYYNAVEIN